MLDPNCGVGTTLVACQNNNRDFIGIELIEEYYNMALERINKDE